MKVYRKVADQPEVCPYGDTHHVGIYEVQTIEVISEATQPDISGYNTGSGTAYWAADGDGHVYYKPYNGFDVSHGWRRDDDVAFFDRPSGLWARDLVGQPLTSATPALAAS